ncbi:hypothetical protein [Sphingomonas parva]|uniref:hypothetical protein n=1 Tax=Sphingomonas parva TaxID=2555898 RepID=UPI001431ECC4|nr:hypothetical protein [Sphingomonas parva]
MTIDDPAFLRRQADRCRRLAEGCDDVRTARVLRDMAAEYEARALAAEPDNPMPTG